MEVEEIKKKPGRPKKITTALADAALAAELTPAPRTPASDTKIPAAVEKHLESASARLIKTIEETKSRIDLLNKELRMQQEELQEIQEFLSQED